MLIPNIADMPVEHRAFFNKAWLEDCSLRLLCVLALDRFGDFHFDKVVVPVRETCAQALAAVVKHLDLTSVVKVVEVLSVLQSRQEWEVQTFLK
jgi:TATA-binding protein-associated factor